MNPNYGFKIYSTVFKKLKRKRIKYVTFSLSVGAIILKVLATLNLILGTGSLLRIANVGMTVLIR